MPHFQESKVTMTFNELLAIFREDDLDRNSVLVFSPNDDPTDEFIVDEVVSEGTIIRFFLSGR